VFHCLSFTTLLLAHSLGVSSAIFVYISCTVVDTQGYVWALVAFQINETLSAGFTNDVGDGVLFGNATSTFKLSDEKINALSKIHDLCPSMKDVYRITIDGSSTVGVHFRFIRSFHILHCASNDLFYELIM
jgi:hypothetical protein